METRTSRSGGHFGPNGIIAWASLREALPPLSRLNGYLLLGTDDLRTILNRLVIPCALWEALPPMAVSLMEVCHPLED